MHRTPSAVEPEVPAELSLPIVPARELTDWRQVQPGQLIELKDGQQGLVLTVAPTAEGEVCALRYVRVTWPRDGALPLGQVCDLSAAAASWNGTLLLHGVWFAATAKVTPERAVIEAIHRGLITSRNCGVTWPMPATWQLSAQAAEQIERYLFEVARSTGCAFPFHDITKALCQMHLRLSPENSAQLDIVTGDSPSRSARGDDEMLSVWARTLQQKIMASDFSVPGLTPNR